MKTLFTSTLQSNESYLKSSEIRKTTQCFLGCLGIFLLSACFPTSSTLKPGAEKVMIADGSHLPQCKELGHVKTFDTNGTTVAYTSHENIQEIQTNHLINKTFELGGNVLVITKHVTTYDTSKHKTVNRHEMQGDAYYCSETKLMKPMEHKAISDAQTQ